MDANEIKSGLAGFYGTEGYHRFSWLYPRLLLTDGAKWLSEVAGAYWLMDAIGSHQPKAMKDEKGMLQNMQFWSLKKCKSNEKTGRSSAHLICERDTDDVAIRQLIEYTDFPLDEIKLYVVADGNGNMIVMLPSEY